MSDSCADNEIKYSSPKQFVDLPKKYLYRQRAHCNPLSDSFIQYPANPQYVNWFKRYPDDCESDGPFELNTSEFPEEYTVPIDYGKAPKVTMLDVGCGYGGLLVYLSELYPEKLALGMEIRDKVTNYVGKRIVSLRQQKPGHYLNISVVRTNSMKFLPNYIGKSQLEKMFFCFPDPHFKRSNWRRRIINYSLLSLYAYVLKKGGRLYLGVSVNLNLFLVTDVYDLYTWMENALEEHPLFESLPSSEKEKDECYINFDKETEEGKKNSSNQVTIYKEVYYRK
ncbi:tRNA (guanine-n-(7))-methyltransferase [Theileria orientalis strain Shintoku]|uniref:tRNA (guanine-N(7)-)-methyltransferase n=1 Tax=Theileria orientalis strain Shintoku TaxID=869250 RepID=J4CC69_THEOR|nr:tRNA (guanine-n-(7))-methyltransferase [Theileria orientalis strain Shintoku]BAM38872.1 tRNA (guanine-n-(7))-methyltransferase [Theileria orientalis strain Shintoku]|eukprot:XP_009689173.1 tRNA (guanine-n-(7))-methyltransferase [Theileria orientalis strain Shintoku]